MAQETLKLERDRFVALAFAWADVTFELDRERRIVFAGGITDPLFGCKARELKGTLFDDLVHADDRGLAADLIAVAARRGRIDNEKVRFATRSGGRITLQMAGYCMPDLDHHFFIGVRVAQLTNPLHPDRTLARDADSGLLDGPSFTDVATGKFREGAEGQLTLVSLGQFNELRERLDPDSYDHLQRSIGACLKANSIDGDTAGRVADDRYSLVHSATVNVADLEARIAKYARAADPTGKGVEVQAATVSVDRERMTAEDLASGLVYVINRFRQSSGKDFTLQSLSQNLSSMVKQATETVEGFKRIVAKADFNMAFQPVFDLGTNKPHHYEVLARFPKAPDEGSPYRYITFAEEMGLIAEFDMAMVNKSIEWLGRYRNDGYQVAVNLSGFSVSLPTFVAELQEILNRNPWAKRILMFEITESSQIADLSAVNRVIQALRRGGHEVCLDDFGAGAANFQYLSTLEVDVVKLDGPALRQARGGTRGKAFIKALTTLCNELRIDVIAEMIDDEEGLQFVKDCGIRFVQGYYFAKPSQDITVFSDPKRMRRSVQPSR